MKKYFLTAGMIILFVFIDMLTKYLVIQNITEFERINIIGTFVQFTLLYNTGGLFGIFQGTQNIFLIIRIFVLCLIIGYFKYEKNKNFLFCFSLSLLISGAAGTILDRIIGRKGVVDFIYIGRDNLFRWPAFNVSDALIVFGAILLFIFLVMEEKRKKAVVK
jgi:signal peptidase II